MSTAWRIALADSPPLNLLVFGAGAIGGYLGGSLALQGHRITFLERQRNAPALRKSGLRITEGDETHHVKKIGVQTSLKAALAAATYDAAFFALKSYDTAAALETIQPFAAKMPPVVCFQNGVDNEPAIAQVIGAENVIAATVTTAIDKPAPGKLVLERKRGVGLAAHHPLSERLHAAMQAAGLSPQLYADPREMKWSKLLANLITNATCAILDLTPAQVFDDPQLFTIEMRALREALAVMRALDLRVVDLPGLPVRALAFAIARLPMSAARPLLARSVGRGRGGKMPSLHIDLHSGKGRSEVAWLNGAVVRWGDQLGVPAPTNRVLSDTLQNLITSNASSRSLSVDDLLSKLNPIR